jgi:flagellar hook-length control protein FliK
MDGKDEQKLEPKKEIDSLVLDSLTEGTILLDQTDNKHQELAEIVRQQLTILEHNKFIMSGMLAPNITFSWEMIGQDKFDVASHKREDLEDSTMPHRSFLKVELPNLGVVAIQIDLQSNQVQLSMKSQTDLAVQELNSHANQLVQSLELSGTHLQSFKAIRDEQL